MTYEQFHAEVVDRGLRAEACSDMHWQILGGTKHPIVNVWANTKKGFRYQVESRKAKTGKLQDAIDLAGMPEPVAPPWGESPMEIVQEPRVGLIRWLWRLLW